MKFIMFILFIFASGFSYASENVGEINVTKQCGFQYFNDGGHLWHEVSVGLTKKQVITAAGSEDGMKSIAVSAELKLKDGSSKKLSGNLSGVMIVDGSLLATTSRFYKLIDDNTRSYQGENPEIVNCTIYY